jgi:ribonuclease HI
MDFLVATDGLCKNNQAQGLQKGSWAFVVFQVENKEYVGHKKGVSPKTTNNEMELRAIVEALLWASKHRKKIEILSDSNYAVRGLTEWFNGWKTRGWKTSKGEPVANVELFQTAHKLLEETGSKISWVKGHAGNKENEMADMYCNEAYIGHFL